MAISHDSIFAEYQRTSDVKVSSLLLAWGMYIHSLDKELFLKPHRLNMLDRRRVEKVWQQFLRHVGATVSGREYRRGFALAWETVRQQKLMAPEEVAS